MCIEDQCECIDTLVHRYSSWHRLRKEVAWLQVFIKWLQSKKTLKAVEITAEHKKTAENVIIRYTQKKNLGEAYQNTRNINQNDPLYKLEPFVNENGVLCEGRLQEANLTEETSRDYT